MRVAVTGTGGRVGAALAARLASRHEVIPLRRADLDLADSAGLDRRLAALDCDVFLNPAAMTSLEACEDDPRLALRVNSAAPGKIAAWAAARGGRMIHFSTDYVFAGNATKPLTECDPPGPLSAYGRSKLAGERAVLAHPGHLVLRVAWVFGPEKPAFVDAVFDAALAGRPLAAVADKFSLPTHTGDLAEWVEALLETPATGLLHACNPGPPVSWHGMAEVVVAEMTRRGLLAAPPPISAQTLAGATSFRAARPRFTAMDISRLAMTLRREPRPWRDALEAHVAWRCGRA